MYKHVVIKTCARMYNTNRPSHVEPCTNLIFDGFLFFLCSVEKLGYENLALKHYIRVKSK